MERRRGGEGANTTSANFGVIIFGHNVAQNRPRTAKNPKNDQETPKKHEQQKGCGARRVWARSPKGGDPEWEAQNFAFFIPLVPQISSYLLFLGVLWWNCCRELRGPPKVRVRASLGSFCASQGGLQAAGVSHNDPRKPKHALWVDLLGIAPRPQFHEDPFSPSPSPPEREERTKFCGGEGKKSEMLGRRSGGERGPPDGRSGAPTTSNPAPTRETQHPHLTETNTTSRQANTDTMQTSEHTHTTPNFDFGQVDFGQLAEVRLVELELAEVECPRERGRRGNNSGFFFIFLICFHFSFSFYFSLCCCCSCSFSVLGCSKSVPLDLNCFTISHTFLINKSSFFLSCLGPLFLLFSFFFLFLQRRGKKTTSPKGKGNTASNTTQNARGNQAAPPNRRGGRRQHHAKREGQTQHHPKKEVKQHHPTEDKENVAPSRTPPQRRRGKKPAPPKGGGEGRQHHAQGHLKEEAKQHHATGTAPPKGGEERQHLPKKEREKKQHHPSSTIQQKTREKQPHPGHRLKMEEGKPQQPN